MRVNFRRAGGWGLAGVPVCALPGWHQPERLEARWIGSAEGQWNTVGKHAITFVLHVNSMRRRRRFDLLVGFKEGRVIVAETLVNDEQRVFEFENRNSDVYVPWPGFGVGSHGCRKG